LKALRERAGLTVLREGTNRRFSWKRAGMGFKLLISGKFGLLGVDLLSSVKF